jgi:hypothetical protein
VYERVRAVVGLPASLPLSSMPDFRRAKLSGSSIASWPASWRTTALERCTFSAAGKKILGSIREARAVQRGEIEGELVVRIPPDFDVQGLGRKLGMSQSKFAATFGFGLDAVQSWEQGALAARGRGASLAQDDRARAGRGEACSGRIAADGLAQ